MQLRLLLATLFSLLFLLGSVEAQFTENLIYPDFIITHDNGTIEESTDWQFANLFVRIGASNSQFIISINQQDANGITQTKLYQLKQTRPWADQSDKVNMCFVKSEEGKEYVLRMIMDEVQGENYLMLSEVIYGDETGWSIQFSKSKKYHDENIMFIGSDGVSAYMYNFLYHNTLKTYKQNLSVDDLSFYYTSHNTILEDKGAQQIITYPIEDYYSSLLTYIDISEFVSIRNGIYTFKSTIDGNDLSSYDKDIEAEMSKSDFGKMKYSWFIPDNIEILEYSASRPGQWEESTRGITFTGDSGNNEFEFEVSYRIKNTSATQIEKTEVKLKESISLKSKQVKVSIWDDNVEDGDIISLSLNGEWIIRNLRVSKCRATFFLDLREEENFLIMKAENIGEKPPNTAAFYFETDNFKKEIILNSDLGKSEMISIKVN